MIPIAIAFTPNYFVQAATLLRSILDASPSGQFKIVCMLTEEIPQRMKDELYQLGGGRLSFDYFMLKGRLDGLYIDPRYTEASSMRLLLPELLPELDRIIYLDCDIIVRQDLALLWEKTCLGDNYLAAVYEAPIENQAEHIRAIGCDPQHYFNAGFTFLNLAQMRSEGVAERLMDACRVPYLEFPDQDALNQVCQGRVLPLSPLYNSIRTFFIPKYKPAFVQQYSEEMWNRVQKEATIHYTGGKPWNLFTVQFGAWWRVYDSLPDNIKAEWNPGKMARFWKFYRTPLGRLLDLIRGVKQLFG